MIGLAIAACGGTSLHLPMTAVELARAQDAQALVLYLSQPGADPAVCDARAAGPHVVADAKIGRGLVEGLRTGTVAPAIWRACVDQVLASTDRAGRTLLLDEVIRSYPVVLGDPALERDPAVQARLAALAAAYRERAPELQANREAGDALAAGLRARLAGTTLGPFARGSATELAALLELERGTWDGRVVDLAVLDAQQTQGDAALLALFAQRLPDATLRAEARRRVIRLRIAASPFAELRDDAAQVEARVLQLGNNPVSPRVQAPTRAAIDPAKLALHGVVVRQDVQRQTAQVSGLGASMIGPIPLRGALSVEVTGLSHPITLCGAARELDPTPCLLPGDVVVASPLVWRDGDGGVHLVEQLTAQQVVELARGGPQLSLPVVIAGRPLAALESTLAFIAPERVSYAGAAPGASGPALRVDVEQQAGRLIYAIDDGHGIRRAVTERAAVRELEIVSRGSAGASGSDGAAGSDGSTGTSGRGASCSASAGDGGAGGDGGNGGNGSDGGTGGNGGDIQVRVRCDDGACDELVTLLRDAIHSEGGEGGAPGSGGRGGSGGHGGSGGTGTTCTDAEGRTSWLSGGSDGRTGSDGLSGSRGSGGARGAPGRVTIDRVPPR